MSANAAMRQLSKHTVPALQEPTKSLFIACIAKNVDNGSYPKEFKINSPKSAGLLSETLYATERFLFDGRMVLFGVGAHWDKDQKKVRYEGRLKYEKLENKMNLTSIEEAARYFPKELLVEITKNFESNRPKKEEEKKARKAKKEEEARKQATPTRVGRVTLPQSSGVKKKKDIRKRLPAAERNFSSYTRRLVQPCATMSAKASNLHYRHNS